MTTPEIPVDAAAPPAGSSAPPAIPAQAYAAAVPQPGEGVPDAKIRSTGTCILLAVVTLGIYPLIWYYSVHEEMKRHSGNGIGGGLALVLALFVGIAMPFITSSEVGALYSRRGQQPPVSGTTGLWYMPGIFILVGPIVWFVKTNGALNSYWASQGVRS